MLFDYITITDALGGDSRRCAPSRRATSPRTTRTTRNDAASPVGRLSPPRSGVTCGYGVAPVPRRCRPRHRRRCASSASSARPGPGKTTLLRVLLGTVRPVAGTVARRPGLRVGYVPQVDTVNWSFPVTVAECVLMARIARAPPAVAQPRRAGRGGGGARAARDRASWAAATSASCRAASSSGCSSPAPCSAGRELLLLDEPTSGVDVRTRHDVLHLLGDLNADGLAIVLTTHDLNGIAAHLPHLVCLRREIIGVGTPAEVLTRATSSAPTARRWR